METSFFSNNYKKYILLYPLGILIGAVVMNLAGLEKINEWGLFNKEIEVTCSIITVAKLVLKERLGHFVILFLICFSTIKDKLLLLFVGWLGLMMGMLQSVFVIQYGALGVVSYIFIIGLHSLIYFFATMGLLIISERGVKNIWSYSMVFVLISYALGVCVETFMSWKGILLFILYK